MVVDYLYNFRENGQPPLQSGLALKFTFSEKATKIDKIFPINLTVCSTCQIDGEDFVNFCGLLGKREL